MKNIFSKSYLIFCLLLGLSSVPTLAAQTTLTFTSDGGGAWSDGIAEDGEGGAANIAGITIQILNITDTSGTNLGSISWKDNNSFLASSDPTFSALTFDQNAGSKGMAIKSSDGSEFQINGFKYYNWGETSSTTVTVKGYRNAVEVASTTFAAYDPSYNPMTIALDSTFDYVDDVRLYISAGGYAGDQSVTNHSINTILIDDPVLPTPTITSATYNASTGALVVTGTNFSATGGATNDVIANKFTLTAEGGSTYTLTDTANVEISSATSFTLTLSATDLAAINQKINKNGTSSTSGTTYNLAGAAGFIAASASTADLTGNGITASNVAIPAITSATYDASTSTFVVTGTNFLSKSGSSNDIDATKFSFRGEGGAGSTYIFIDTPSVDLTSDTSFTLVLGTADKNAINLIADKNGTTSVSGSSFLLNGIEDWAAGADSAVTTIDSGNTVTVSNVAVPTITSATYDVSTGVLVVTGTGFLRQSGSTNDIVANKFTFTGQGGSTYILTDTPNVEVTSTTSFTLTLSSTDRSAISLLLNKNGTSSIGGTTYNLAAAEDWAAGADSAVTVADLTGNGITASNASTVPGAPTIGTASAGDTQATVTFTAPGGNGGSAITTYTATANPGGATGACAGPAACTITVTGLTNGTAYTFTVTATNAVGTGSASGASNSVTPKGAQTITFSNPGSQNFGTTPTLTATSTSSLTVSFSSTTTGVCTITSGGALTFVSAGTCTIDADQAGNGTWNAATTVSQSFTVNAVVPNAPTIGTATAGDTQATVTFTAPASAGGANITGYTVTASPGGATGTGASSPITVTGLTNGISYTFTVTATNSAGTGAASSTSNAITPKAPQTITFANPGSQNFGTNPDLRIVNGGASATSGLNVTFTSSTTGVCAITSEGVLTFITVGSCTINADQAGDSNYLAATQVTRTFTVNAIVPGAPTSVVATAGDNQASVAFAAPTNTGGTSITVYTVTVSPADVAPVNGAGSPIVITGLTNGQPYTFTVTADNSAGTGPSSSSSNSITPAATQTITFNNPGAQSFGTTPTLSATSDSGLTPAFTSSTTAVCTITTGGALTFVTTGTCTINADQGGNGSYLAATQVTRSFTVNAVVPGAPTIGTATAGNAQASVTFTAPAFTGGATITGYTVTANPGGVTASGTNSPITVPGLTNGVSYTFTVRATNSAGTGTASAASNAVVPIASQTISFANPGAQNFGTTPTLTATATSGLTVVFNSATTGVCTITTGGLLTFISTGTCTISTSQAGNVNFSAATPVDQSFNVVAVVPAAPTIGTATAGNTQASVTFTAPGFNGGAAVTSYTVTANPGGVTASGTTSPITVTGLTNGTAYTFTVTATNSVGAGPASAASNAVTPTATQTITFANPGTQNLGTTPSLIATASSGLAVAFSSTTPSVCTVTSGGLLTLLVAGTCTIDVNQAGDTANQPAPTVSQSFSVAVVVPGAPTIGVVTVSSGQASVAFTAPSVTGSSAITGYTVTSSPGGITATGSSSPIVVTGLTDGVTYTFTVTATSAAGTGVPSSASAAVTPKTAQTITFANPGDQNLGTTPNLVATASSGLTVSFTSSTPMVCVVSMGQLVLMTTGTCSISAEQAGNTVYAEATAVSQSVTINPALNGVPVITQGSLITVTMSEDGAPTAFSLELTATDSDNDTLTWEVVTQPAHGSASITSNGAISYIPTENYNGTDSFIVSVTDGEDTANAQVDVTLSPVNDAPVISGVPTTSLNQDTAYSFVPAASDVDTGTTLTFSITNKPAWASFDTSTGALTGTPVAANVGTTSAIVISVSDGTATKSLPAFAIQVVSTVDPSLPVLTVPANLQLDATGLYTPVTLRQLLKLATNSTASEVDTSLGKLATDSAGTSCCTTVAAGVTATQPLLLPPGRHEVKWTATNTGGMKTTGVQVVDVRPLVSLSKSQMALRGANTEFRIILNGKSPTYPVSVSYVIDEATTATTAEHTLTSGTATLDNAGQLEVAVPVTLKPVNGLANSQLTVRLTGDANIGATNRHTISIREGNVPPTVTLILTQNSFPATVITPNGGPVTVTAQVTDPNTSDTHSFDWSATTGLVDTDGNATNATRVFNATGLTGSHQVQVAVKDSAGAMVQAQLYFRVAQSLPVLSATLDTDDDGITDELEGIGDADTNGIPDYLDNMPSSNILPQKIVTTDKYLIECDPGVRCGLGLLAMASSTGGVQILESEVATLGNMKTDASFTPVGGIFDFAVTDLPTAAQSINIAIPQVAPIPAKATYRKFQKGQWFNFVENADNVLRSAPGNPGYCPPPGSTDWKPGLVEGYYCVQLTISDGGPNDGDGIVNSAVVDPGVVSVAATVTPPVEPPKPPVEIKTKGGGGAMDYALLMLMGALVLMHRRSRLLVAGAFLLITATTHADDFSNNAYLRVDVYQVNGGQSEYEFTSALAREGYGFTLTKYDVSRTGYQLALGYKWNENVYSELGYLHLGDVHVNLWLDGDESQAKFGKSFARRYPGSGNGFTLVQGVKLVFNDHWSVSPELGAFIWKKEVDVNGAEFRVGNKSNVDLLVGLRLDYQINESFGLGLGVRSILFEKETVNLWGISTRWDF